MTSKLDQHFFFHTQALNLRTQRQTLIASNIANADTPNYKARDIDFGKALEAALAGRSGGALQMARTASNHLPRMESSFAPDLMYRQETQASADGNTVNMDIERAEFSDNAIRYEAGVTFLTQRIKGILDAMQSPRS